MLSTMYLRESRSITIATTITIGGYFLIGVFNSSLITGSRMIFNGDIALNPPMFLKSSARKVADFSRG